MYKELNFKNKTWEQVRASYLNLKTRYKHVKFPKAHYKNGLITGILLVLN